MMNEPTPRNTDTVGFAALSGSGFTIPDSPKNKFQRRADFLSEGCGLFMAYPGTHPQGYPSGYPGDGFLGGLYPANWI